MCLWTLRYFYVTFLSTPSRQYTLASQKQDIPGKPRLQCIYLISSEWYNFILIGVDQPRISVETSSATFHVLSNYFTHLVKLASPSYGGDQIPHSATQWCGQIVVCDTWLCASWHSHYSVNIVILLVSIHVSVIGSALLAESANQTMRNTMKFPPKKYLFSHLLHQSIEEERTDSDSFKYDTMHGSIQVGLITEP